MPKDVVKVNDCMYIGDMHTKCGHRMKVYYSHIKVSLAWHDNNEAKCFVVYDEMWCQ